MTLRLRCRSSRTRITALHVLNDFILAGSGNELSVFRLGSNENNKMIGTYPVLSEGQVVHGVMSVSSANRYHQGQQIFGENEHLLLAWGEKGICILSLVLTNNGAAKVKVHLQHTLPDWIIYSSMYCEEKDCGKIMSLSAHNRLFKLKVDTKTWMISDYEESGCDEKCILYSGFIKVAKTSVVLAGTVFGRVLVWTEENERVIHSLTGHKGVILSVSFDSILNIIVSTSDDRSARIWQVSFEGDNQDWNQTRIVPLTTLEGHLARVFCHKVCHSNNNEHLLVTAGEDSNIMVWAIHMDDKEALQIDKMCNLSKVHNGAVCWALAAMQTSNDVLLVSGGGDHSIRTTALLSQPSVQCYDDLNDCGVPRVVRMWGKTLFCLFDKGQIAVYEDCDKDKAKFILQDNRLKSYGLLELGPYKTGNNGDAIVLFLATLEGSILRRLFSCSQSRILVDNSVDKELFHSKVFSMHILNDEHLLVCGREGKLKLISNIGLDVMHEFVLPDHRRGRRREQRWPSVAVCKKRANSNDLLYVGDRCGNIFVFDVEKKRVISAVDSVHDSNGVAALKIINRTTNIVNDEDSSVMEEEMEEAIDLISTGRDGKLVTLRWKDDNSSFSSPMLAISQVNKLSDLKSIERIIDLGEDRLLLGFHSSYFAVFSQKQNRVLSRIQCGGNHRSWDAVIEGCQSMTMSFIKDKKLYVASMVSNLSQMITAGGHRSQCWALAKSANLLFTAGEDGLIIVFLPQDGQIQRLSELRGHISSVRSVHVVNFENKEFLISAGGRAQLIIWRINEVNTAEVIAKFFLRGNARSIRKMKQWRSVSEDSNQIVQDCEMRLMDVVAFLDSNVIVALGSDGNLFLLSLENSVIRLVYTTDDNQSLKNACYLKCARVSSDSFFTTSTDGILRLWNIVDNGQLVLKQDWIVATAGLNALCVVHALEAGVKRILCGGDDGAIYYSRKVDSFEKTLSFRQINLHSSQITSIREVDNNVFLSTSTNQRLMLWGIHETEDGGEELAVIQSVVTSISGVQDACMLPNDKGNFSIVVVGEGIAHYYVLTEHQ